MKKIFLTITLALFVIPIGMSQDLPSYVPTNGLVAITHLMEMQTMKVGMETMVQLMVPL